VIMWFYSRTRHWKLRTATYCCGVHTCRSELWKTTTRGSKFKTCKFFHVRQLKARSETN